MRKIGIIIVNYKDYAEKFLSECKNSLDNQTFPKDQFQVYIVDNASTESSLNYLESHFKDAKVLPRPDGNFSAANNLGAQKAIEDECEIIIALNMDVVLDEDWLKNLVEQVESNKEGIYQSKMLLHSNKELVNSEGNLFHYLGFGFTDGYNKLNDKDESEIKELKGYVSGCAIAFHKDVYEKLGGWNEEYYMYHDDLEMGWKAKLLGIKSYLVPNSIVYHKYEFSRSVQMVYYMERNRYLAILHFYKWQTIIIFLPILIVLDLAMWLYSIIGGWGFQKLKVFLYFIRITSWKKIFQTRKKVQTIRKTTDKQILNSFEGKVLFQEINNPILQYFGNPIMNLYLKLAKKVIFW